MTSYKTQFSILIPAYKGTFLAETISSCLEQTFSDFEIIIINDASPENLDVIVERYKDDRIRYYKNEKNFGALNVVDNWNKCLSYSLGEYVICIGDDDRLLPNCLAEYDNLIKIYPSLNVYHGWTQIIDENSVVYDMQEPRPILESVYPFIWHRWHGRNRQFIGDFCFRSKQLQDLGGFYKLPLAWASDDISAVMMFGNKQIANTQIPCFQYRVSKVSISESINGKYKISAINLEEHWYNTFLKGKPIDTCDQIYYNMILKDIDLHFEKKRAHYIAKDMKSNIFMFVYWLWQTVLQKITINCYLRSFKYLLLR